MVVANRPLEASWNNFRNAALQQENARLVMPAVFSPSLYTLLRKYEIEMNECAMAHVFAFSRASCPKFDANIFSPSQVTSALKNKAFFRT